MSENVKEFRTAVDAAWVKGKETSEEAVEDAKEKGKEAWDKTKEVSQEKAAYAKGVVDEVKYVPPPPPLESASTFPPLEISSPSEFPTSLFSFP